MSCIVIAKRGPDVVLAGDSLSTFHREDGPTWQAPICKVRPAGDRWGFALAGVQGKTMECEAYDLVEAAIEHTTTLDGAFRAIVSRADDLDRGMREYFEVSGEQAFLRIWLAGLDDTTGTVVAGLFQGDQIEGAPFRTKFKWGGIRSEQNDYILGIGLDGAAAAVMNTTPRPDWLARADAAACRRVIAMQIAETPERCGPPVSLLAVNAEGVRWIEEEEQVCH